MTDCVFCEKINAFDGVELADGYRTYSFEPLNPVVPGHMLFVSMAHTIDAAERPDITAEVFSAASWYAQEHGKPFNLITSGGSEATQTVMHLHVHYVPRVEGDGLYLPWTNQVKLGSTDCVPLELDEPKYDYQND